MPAASIYMFTRAAAKEVKQLGAEAANMGLNEATISKVTNTRSWEGVLAGSPKLDNRTKSQAESVFSNAEQATKKAGGEILRPRPVESALVNPTDALKAVEDTEIRLLRKNMKEELQLFKAIGKDVLVSALTVLGHNFLAEWDDTRMYSSFVGIQSKAQGFLGELAALQNPEVATKILEKSAEVKEKYPHWDPRPVVLLGSRAEKSGERPLGLGEYVDIVVLYRGKEDGPYKDQHAFGIAIEIKNGDEAVKSAVYKKVKNKTTISTAKKWLRVPGQFGRILPRLMASGGTLHIGAVRIDSVHLIPPSLSTGLKSMTGIPEATYLLVATRPLRKGEQSHLIKADMRVDVVQAPYKASTIKTVAHFLTTSIPSTRKTR